MNKIMLVSALSAIVAPLALASEGWETNMDAAKKKAAEENKGLLIEFTGSDWCGFCKILKKEVLTKDQFLNEAQKDFVLVELDYPRQTPLSPEQTAHNDKYRKEYGISGYPTIIFTDATGRPVQEMPGYRNLEKVLESITTAKGNRIFVEETLTKLKDAKGDDRLVLIGELFNKVPVEYMTQFYPDLAKEIKADTNDKSGLKKILADKDAEAKFKDIMRSIPREFRMNAQKIYDHVESQLQKTEAEIEPLVKQKLLSYQAMLLQSMDKIDEAILKFAESVKAVPDSEVVAELIRKKEFLEKNKDMILKSSKQRKALGEYRKQLPQDVQNNPEQFAKAFETYLKDNELVPSIRESVIGEIAFAKIGGGKTDEALTMIQEEIDAPDSPSMNQDSRNRLKKLKERIEKNRAEIEKNTKTLWEKKAAGKVIPAVRLQ